MSKNIETTNQDIATETNVVETEDGDFWVRPATMFKPENTMDAATPSLLLNRPTSIQPWSTSSHLQQVFILHPQEAHP